MRTLDLLEKGLQEWSLSLTDEQKEQFLDYYDLLIEWNEKMNLTAVTDFEEVQIKHFLDSLALLRSKGAGSPGEHEIFLHSEGDGNSGADDASLNTAGTLDTGVDNASLNTAGTAGSGADDTSLNTAGTGSPADNIKNALTAQSAKFSVLDLGTGAGFPGIPLKIFCPDIHITLADSLNKRLVFLQEVIRCLGLQDAVTVHGRAEDLASDRSYRESFDLCTSRAVANLSTLSEYCLPFVRTGGYFVSYKGADSDEEIRAAAKAIHLLGGKKEAAESFTLPLSDYGRTLVWIRKARPTPKKYPRRAGTPSREPL